MAPSLLVETSKLRNSSVKGRTLLNSLKLEIFWGVGGVVFFLYKLLVTRL